jgi:hypothetical protein
MPAHHHSFNQLRRRFCRQHAICEPIVQRPVFKKKAASGIAPLAA